MIRLLVLADDLTGAIDTSIQFSKHGISTLVTLETSLESVKNLDAEVIAVDMETRHTDKRTASAVVSRLVQEANQIGIRWIYIKVDSTLRGNIGSELEAALMANGNDKLFFVPAFPAAKRITCNAIQYVDNVPLNETMYANDPFTPVVSGFIPDIIAEQTDLPIITVTLDDLNDVKALSTQKSIVVVDAKNEEELFQIASTLLKDDRNTLMAGSAGFAMMFSQMLGLEEELRSNSFLRNAKRVLVVCGSLNSISAKQVAYAESVGMQSMRIPEEQKNSADYFKSEAGQVDFKQMCHALEQDKVLILKALLMEETFVSCDTQINNRQVAQNIGSLVVELMRQCDVDYLVVFGGDTLYGILTQMGGSLINLNKEFEPGIVCSTVSFENRPLCIISKAGGFGDSLTLTNILRYIGKQE